MAVDLNAYFKTRVSQPQIERSLYAQGWQFTAQPVNAIATDYVTEPHLGFFLTIVEKKKMLNVNDSPYPAEQYWSFRLGRSSEEDFEIDYSAIARLIDWITATYRLECCLTWDGESVRVLFNQGMEYIVNEEAEFWADYIRPIMKPEASLRFDTFDWL